MSARLTPADLHRAVTGERALILAHIDGKIRACERVGEPAADTLHRLTILHEEIAAGLHVPDPERNPEA